MTIKKTIKKIIQSKAIYSGFVLLASCIYNNETDENQPIEKVELSSIDEETKNTTLYKNDNVQNNSSGVTGNNNSANDAKKESISNELDKVKSRSFIQKHPKSIIATVVIGAISGSSLGMLAGAFSGFYEFYGLASLLPALGASSSLGVALVWTFIGLVSGLILGAIVSCLFTKLFPKSK